MALELITPPAEEPLTLADAKSTLRITDTAEDAWVSAAIRAVRERMEAFCRRAIITQTWRWWLDAFPLNTRELHLPRPPLISITHLKTRNDADTVSTFDPDLYLVDTASEPGRLVLRRNAEWPSDLRAAQGIEIELAAGYGTAADIPAPLVEGMRLWLRLLYANRTWLFDNSAPQSGLVDFNREFIPTPVRVLWDPYRLDRI